MLKEPAASAQTMPEALSPQPEPPQVACVLINWNNWPDTSACLAALALQQYPSLHVIVVDNASTDGSLDRLRSSFPWAHFIANPRNIGFPKACNAGARHSLAVGAEFIWFLNNDTVPPPGTVQKLVTTALANPRAGIVGAVLFFLDDPSRVQAWGGGAVGLWTGFNTHYLAPTPFNASSYITFASAFVRRATFDQLGGLFEGAFMYFEDSDFSLRARAAGWDLVIATDTAILHRVGGTIRPGSSASRSSSAVDRMVTTAGLLFLGRHAPFPPLAYALFLGSRLAKRLLHLDLAAFAAVFSGARDWSLSRPPS